MTQGLGQRPKRVWAAAQRFHKIKENVVSQQDVKQPTIETGLICKARI